jgi:methylated-DNA-[protein]-cysteine S-methyltransferase
MPTITVHPFRTPYGELLLGSFEDQLCLCDWRYRRMRTAVDARIQRGLNAAYEEGMSSVITAAVEQLDAYFSGERRHFDLPLRCVGTEFQQRVWEALVTVPYGTTMTYADLTAKVAAPTAIRAVASANGANAHSIIIPCHRIVGSDGEMVGYAGGLSTKRKLLLLEGAVPVEHDLFTAQAEA